MPFSSVLLILLLLRRGALETIMNTGILLYPT